MQREPQELRELARRCRERVKSSTDPSSIEQLRRWAVELVNAADEIERDAEERTDATMYRILDTKQC